MTALDNHTLVRQAHHAHGRRPPCAASPSRPSLSNMRASRFAPFLLPLFAWSLVACGGGQDPARCAAGADSDGDGLDNAVECSLGTNPFEGDSDMDGIADGAEAAYPRACIAVVGSDQRRPPPACTADPDCLSGERCRGLDPTSADSDGDGLSDLAEDTGLDGVFSGTETDPRLEDTDGDGTADGASLDGGTGGGGDGGRPCDSITDCRFGEECVSGICTSTLDGGESGSDGGVGFDMTPSGTLTGPGRGRIIGHVTDLAGVALADTRVSLTPAGAEVLTDAAGNYELDVEPGAYVVHFSREGYLSVHRRTTVAAWERVYINVSLMTASAPDMVDATAGGVAESEGASFRIPPGSLRDGAGVPVTGAVEVAVTPIDPTTGDLEGAPGDFVGSDPMGGSMPDSPIVSYGMVDVSVTDPSGMPLDMADGSPPAEVVIPATTPPGAPPVMPGDEIPFWRFDPETGVWILDGVAVAEERDGVVVFVGQATQPGVYNCDVPVVPVCVTGRVQDCSGYGIPGAEVRMTTSTTSRTTARTDVDGNYRICGAVQGEAIIRATVNLGAVALTEDTPRIPAGSGGDLTAPPISFDGMRYVTGTIEVSRAVSRTWTGRADAVISTPSALSYFWDIGRAPVPRFVTCDGPTDTLVGGPLMSSGSGGGEFVRMDVGNPITVGSGVAALPLFRYYGRGAGGAVRLDAYRAADAAGLAAGPSALDITIPGAAGAMPAITRSAALVMPADLTVTSPAADTARSFARASSIPLRWAPPPAGSDTEINIVVLPDLASGTQLLRGTLVDDGSFDLDVSSIGPVSGATVTLQRTARRFQRLPTGPQMMLQGSSAVTLSLELR